MYLGIDIGGSKTLLAVFSVEGQIVDEQRFPTAAKYPKFLNELKRLLADDLKAHHISHCCCAVPGLVDRQRGIGLKFGSLSWRDVPLKSDLQQLMPKAQIYLENDSNLAGLSEAHLVQDKYKKVLYLTISTGIGDGIIINGIIDPDFADSESGHMVLEHDGQLRKWQDFASGRAIVERYGEKAAELDDPAAWRQISQDLALGLNELVATLQPDVIIIGGGVGTHFNKYGAILNEELKKLESALVEAPPVIQAKRPEEAVIYGCFDFIRQNLDAH